jgi:hypothetical protein
MVKLKHLHHPFQTTKAAKALLATRFAMWRFAAHGKRRFRSDSRFFLQNVTEGFRSRLDKSTDDAELLERICMAYIKTVTDLQSVPDPFGATEKARQLRQRSLVPVAKALLTRDIDSLRRMYSNFFRDSCSAGLLGVPYGMSKAYFGGAIKDVHRRFYLSHVLYRIDYWASQTEGNFPLSDLSGPLVGNPFGVVIDETFVKVGAEYSHYCAYRVSELIGAGPATVAEIRSGFGGMAYYLLRDKKTASYIGFDTPENIALTSYYLMKALPQLKFLLYGEGKLTREEVKQNNVALMPISEIANIPAESIDITFSSHALSDVVPEVLPEYLNHIVRITRGSFLSISNRSVTKSISDLVSERWGLFRLAETRSSGWHSHKVSGAGVGGPAGLAASLAFEQCYKRETNLCDDSI